jgi:hypothetical protein
MISVSGRCPHVRTRIYQYQYFVSSESSTGLTFLREAATCLTLAHFVLLFASAPRRTKTVAYLNPVRPASKPDHGPQ